MAKIISEIFEKIREDYLTRRVLVGVHWTVISSRGCGMASTVVPRKPHGEEIVLDAGNLSSKSALELAQYLYSENTLEAGIGLAALNSLIEPPNEGTVEINAFKYLVNIGAAKRVAVFGHFPYMSDLKKSAYRLTVFELEPGAEEHHLNEAPELLPDADIVAITSNSLINHTLEEILSHIRGDAFVALVGPSTPLSSVLFDHGISMLSGVRVVNEDELFTTVSQAAIFRQTRGVQLVTWIK